MPGGAFTSWSFALLAFSLEVRFGASSPQLIPGRYVNLGCNPCAHGHVPCNHMAYRHGNALGADLASPGIPCLTTLEFARALFDITSIR